jgi:hypothetical protein
MQKEEFTDVPGYEGLYQISNLCNLKSLSYLKKGNKSVFKTKEKILSKHINKQGYLYFKLSKDKKRKTYKVHQLMAITFLNHNPCGMDLVIDHIDNDKLNNRVENLQIITSRENCSKDRKNKTSKYTGVSWCKLRNKWKAQIQIKTKKKYLGLFNTELHAYEVYQNELKTL